MVYIMKGIIAAFVEFGRLMIKYILDPLYRAMMCIYSTLIKPVLKFLDYIILRPIRWVLGIVGTILYKIWDFFDDITIEICYDGDEYRDRRREKDERRMEAHRKVEMNQHKTEKFSRTTSNKQTAKQYIDFFGGNKDIAVQYMQAQAYKNESNHAPELYLYNQNVYQNNKINQQLPHPQNNMGDSQIQKESPHHKHHDLGYNNKHHHSKEQRANDAENFYICPSCHIKLPLSAIETHQSECLRI